jgi:hypothetical protein
LLEDRGAYANLAGVLGLQEYFSGYDNIGHNPWQDLIILWIIPNGAWLVFPTYFIYVMGGEIVEGLTAASTGVPIKSE